MRASRIKAKLRKNQPVLLTTLHYSDPSIYEMASLMGFDGIWLDLEHHHHSVETANTLLRAARVGTSDVMVRCAKGEFMRMGRLLEAGATGIMYPRCDNAAEAREVVRWAKFAPRGQRGIDTANPDNPYCLMPLVDYLKAANEQTFVVVQIEEPSALSQVDEIAAVDGVDIVFFGPGDFSILSGIPGQWEHALIKDAMRKVSAACQKAGKHWGMPIFHLEHAQEVMSLGGRFLCHSADILILKNAFDDIQKKFAPLGVTCERPTL
jgi:4-hydroxy-2-oxoheptanedioate aldolase